MAASMSFFQIIIMMLSGGVGGDFLDFVPAEAYFKAQGIEYKAPALIAVLEAPVPEDKKARAADSALRQLAVRELAVLGAKDALPLIEKLITSRDRLLADYAKSARAKLGGKPYTRLVADPEELQMDLSLLPSGVGALGQMKMSSGEPVDLAAQMKKMMGGPAGEGGPDVAEMEAQMVGGMAQIAGMMGNFRINSITFGLASEVGPNSGHVVLVMRGLYDHDAFESMLGERIGGVRRKAGGLTFYELETNTFYVAPVSDKLLVGIAGADIEELPLDEVGKKVAAGGGDFTLGGELARMLGRVDRKAPIWAIAEVTEAYKQAPFLKPFKTLQMTGTKNGDTQLMKLSAQGDDAAGADKVIEEMRSGLAEMKKGIAEQGDDMPMLKDIKAMVDGVKISGEGGSAQLEVPMSGEVNLGSLPMLIFMGTSRVEVIPDHADPEVEAQEAKPVRPEPAAAE